MTVEIALGALSLLVIAAGAGYCRSPYLLAAGVALNIFLTKQVSGWNVQIFTMALSAICLVFGLTMLMSVRRKSEPHDDTPLVDDD